MTQDIHLMPAVTSITFFFETDVKCGLCEINKKQQSKCYVTRTESGPKYVQDKPNRIGPGPGPGPVLTLHPG